MKNFFKLLNFELNRVMKLLIRFDGVYVDCSAHWCVCF